jgi:hypothetical protein
MKFKGCTVIQATKLKFLRSVKDYVKRYTEERGYKEKNKHVIIEVSTGPSHWN